MGIRRASLRACSRWHAIAKVGVDGAAGDGYCLFTGHGDKCLAEVCGEVRAPQPVSSARGKTRQLLSIAPPGDCGRADVSFWSRWGMFGDGLHAAASFPLQSVLLAQTNGIQGKLGTDGAGNVFVSGIPFFEPIGIPTNCVTNTCNNIGLVLPRKLSSHEILSQHLRLVTSRPREFQPEPAAANFATIVAHLMQSSC